MTYPFHNLVFEGGGVKGVVYVGALAILEEKGILPQITRVGGTSAGAINAMLLGVSTTAFDLDSATKLQLVESGLTHTKRYFDWYDDPQSTPANRPG